MKKFLILFVFALIVIFGAGAGLVWQQFGSYPASSDTTEQLFEVTHGKTFRGIIHELADKKLIRSEKLFFWYAKLTGRAGKMKVGEYALSPSMRPGEILSVINSGISVGREFTVSEGLNIYEIADLYQQQNFGTRDEFLKACHDKMFLKQLLGEDIDSCEGYLFPETYQLTKFTTTKELLAKMIKKFTEVYALIQPQNHFQSWTRNQIVTLASIIEKETGAPEERPEISAVFHNRLQKGMLLQTDPTILYGLTDLAGHNVMSIGHEDIHRPTKYNTYVIRGLPPGPIANPGREAMLAAMNPANVNYLYFVSKNDGTHIFSVKYEDHAKAVHEYQKNALAREGHSWRELQKNRKGQNLQQFNGSTPATGPSQPATN
jgi:UPF0755 protein